MAALLKKRALAEYCQTVQEEPPRPVKKIVIVKRTRPSETWDFNLNNLDANSNPKVIIKHLLTLQQALPPPSNVLNDVVKKLNDLLHDISKFYNSEDKNMKDNVNYEILCTKLVCLLSLLVLPKDAQMVLERIMNLAKGTESPRLMAHSIQAVCTITRNSFAEGKLKDNVLQFVLSHLESTNYLIKVRCLEAIGTLCSTETCRMQSKIIKALVLHTSYQDSRVRTAALNALLKVHQRGIMLPENLHEKACSSMKDDYQGVREAALHLIQSLASRDPERIVTFEGSEHETRLIDYAFSQICDCVNDGSIRVRTLSCSLLGKLNGVSDQFLLQTLDKKLMSNMRRKCSAHERARVIAASGEWSTGRRWMDDAPKEKIEASEAQVVSSGSCGAFVHGLEDEFLEVRNASLDAMCQLAEENLQFANQSLDFLVDMFNDEIEEVRLKAIQVLQKIAHQAKLRPDQLDEILHALKDSTIDIRESLHLLLSTCTFTTMTCITSVITALLNNIRQYPQDKKSIYKCLKQIGNNHPDLVHALVPQLLSTHPYFDEVEPNVQDEDYLCKLILILNAASHCPTMLSQLNQYSRRHYAYLRDTMPNFVPLLPINESNDVGKELCNTNTVNFLTDTLKKLSIIENGTTTLKLNTYSTIQEYLNKLASLDSSISASANMASLYVQSMQWFAQIFANRSWSKPAVLSDQQSTAVRTWVDKLMRITLKLRYAFTDLSPLEFAALRSLRVRTLALQLVYVVHGSTGSALGLCDNFLEHIESLHQYLVNSFQQSDSFITAVVQELSQIDDPRPGAVARILQPLLFAHTLPTLQPFVKPEQIRMAFAEILEPSSDSELVYKVSAGIPLEVLIDAEVWHVGNIGTLRVRVSYPDNTTHLLIPGPADVRRGDSGCHRLLFNVLLCSPQVWTESCQVGISLVLDMNEEEFLAGRKQLTGRSEESNTIVHLCQPINISVWTRHIRKGI